MHDCQSPETRERMSNPPNSCCSNGPPARLPQAFRPAIAKSATINFDTQYASLKTEVNSVSCICRGIFTALAQTQTFPTNPSRKNALAKGCRCKWGQSFRGKISGVIWPQAGRRPIGARVGHRRRRSSGRILFERCSRSRSTVSIRSST
jgi:hypothetical protein